MSQLNFFEKEKQQNKPYVPLAERMRPEKIEDFVGQKHLLEKGKILDRLLRTKKLQSLILWGPPGSGKTTLAKIITKYTETHMISLSAVAAGTKDIRHAVKVANSVSVNDNKPTWLFMDEIHRLNKAQQDVLLPYVEDGTILLLGATTENPSFEVIRPLLSRSQVLVLEPLKEEDLKLIIKRAIEDETKGLGKYNTALTEDAKEFLIAISGGDGRIILNTLETSVLTTEENEDSLRYIDLEIIKDITQRKALHYDKSGEEHYNVISALHKSIRGSDPDAALYWLARMLECGEDPLYITRRLIRAASEDIGLADPFALMEAIHVFKTYEILGSPEGELAIAQLVVYLSIAQEKQQCLYCFQKSQEGCKKLWFSACPFPHQKCSYRSYEKTGLWKRL